MHIQLCAGATNLIIIPLSIKSKTAKTEVINRDLKGINSKPNGVLKLAAIHRGKIESRFMIFLE